MTQCKTAAEATSAPFSAKSNDLAEELTRLLYHRQL